MNNIIFEEYFEKSNLQPFLYKGKEILRLHTIKLPSAGLKLRISFLSVNSEWKQAIVLHTKGQIVLNGDKFKNRPLYFWEDTAPKVFKLTVKSKDEILKIYNGWDTGDGAWMKLYNGAAMYLEPIENGLIYHCNDGHPNDDFTDLVFKVEYI